MTTDEEILKEIKKQEENLSLYNIKVLGVSFWRLVRFEARIVKLNKETDFTNKTKKIRVSILTLITNYLISFVAFLKFLAKRKQYENLVLAFPRLVKNRDGAYFDKFTDPIINQMGLKQDTLVVQRSLDGKHFKPRLVDNNGFMMSDFFDYTSKLLSVFFFPFFYIIYFKEIKLLYSKSASYFHLNNRFKIKMCLKIGDVYFRIKFWQVVCAVAKFDRAFLVNREVFFPQIIVCKKQNITTYELQHGITHSETPLYTGDYQLDVDPDYFLAFGEKWRGTQFGMPLERLKNIGWAYKDWVSSKSDFVKEKSVLVISSPEITEKILRTTIEMAKVYGEYHFVLRLHPQEELSEIQLEQVKAVQNIELDDTSIDSALSVLKNQYCIGRNSSVLYEALDYGKIVGKIMYNGLDLQGDVDSEIRSLHYIKSLEDFKCFLHSKLEGNRSLGVYDTFKNQVMEGILVKKKNNANSVFA